MPKEGQYLLEVQDGVGVHHPLEEGVEMVHEDVFCGCEGGGAESHRHEKMYLLVHTHTYTQTNIHTYESEREESRFSHVHTHHTKQKQRANQCLVTAPPRGA